MTDIDDICEIAKFWKLTDKAKKRKETQYEFYFRNNASENILRFIKLGGGPSLGCIAEQYCKFKFNELKSRFEGDTGHDHTIVINDKVVKIEQKTSTLNKQGDWMWQHIAEKHSWDILLFMGIHFNEIKFYGITKSTFNELVAQKKITNQGNKNMKSEQGMWCKYSNIKNDVMLISTNDDIKKLYNDDKVVNKINDKCKI